MALNVGKLVIGNEKQEEVNPKPLVSNPVTKNEEQQINQTKRTHGDHVLIVDGKPKKISKKSAYLLDMLTSD